MATTRIVYMGTPEFAVPSLKALLGAGQEEQWDVVGVATQPDRRSGRGKKVHISPVKAVAQEADLPLLQPVSFRKEPEMVEALAAWAPDLLVVAAYGLILPVSVLEIPRFGAINVHASMLPAYRGASPINAALLDGLEKTGVSIMLMDKGMDTGPVLKQCELSIAPDDTTESLGLRLADLGAWALVDTLPGWLAGSVAPTSQEDLPGEASLCRLIKKQDGLIDWSQPALLIERMTRAYTPWPGAFTIWQDTPFKVHRASVRFGSLRPGQVAQIEHEVVVGTGADLLVLERVQPAGKRAMDIRSFLNGTSDFVGARLGNVAND